MAKMNIVTPSLDELMPKVDSRYTLVTLAAKRARDIVDGKEVMEDRRCNREVSNDMEGSFEYKVSL